MKIFALVNNHPQQYVPGPLAEGPLVWDMLPDSCLLRSGNVLFLPDLTHRYEAVPTLAVKIGRLGKSIAPRFAHRYVAEITVALHIRDLTRLDALREAGLPWVMAWGFDRSLVTGNFVPADDLAALADIKLEVTDTVTHTTVGSCGLIIDLPHVIEAVSRDNTLKNGDLILPSLAPSGLVLKPGQLLSASLDGRSLLEVKIK
ncbi:MAG: fumarylacetoacetate hydrolase family protein [Muribaculaceae bacterium]|nr:fumarylacetoacetate hydrolase family protein [Muribaculaceae bacterium]